MLTKTPQTAKYKRFVRRLRAMLPQLPIDVETVAVGILERLWHTTATSAPRGDIGKLEDELIAEMVGWYGSATELVRLLVECEWLDEDDQYRLVVHDWHDHAPNHVKGNVNRMGGFVTQGNESDTDSDGCPNDAPKGTSQGTGPGDQPSHACGLPYQTRPDLTLPYQTRPDLTGPGPRAVVRSGPVVDFGFLSGRVEELREKLQRFPLKSLDRDLAWRVICLDAVTRNGFASSIVDSFRSGRGVRKPGSFVNRAIVQHCDEHKLDHGEFCRSVPVMHDAAEQRSKSARDEMIEAKRSIARAR